MDYPIPSIMLLFLFKHKGPLMQFKLEECKHILIFGAGHGIGLALVEHIRLHFPQITVCATYRQIDKAHQLIQLEKNCPDQIQSFEINPTSESNIIELANLIETKTIQFDLIINAIGLLHSESIKPEKSLKDFNPESFLQLISVNTMITVLIAKHFQKFFVTPRPCALIAISAKVGSIGDNRMGGWHSYRASKAALNMMIKNISIEFKQKRLNSLVLAIHPGTTQTELSAPYTKNTTYIVHPPSETAKHIFEVIDNRSIEDTGRFFSWEKQEIEW